MKRVIIVILVVLFIDQFLKIWVKLNMTLGEQYTVIENFFYLHFTENPGMAFGIQLESKYGKLLLSVFRILAMLGIGWYLHMLMKQSAHKGLIFCISLIMAGAIGNIIDSAFYGLIFDKGIVKHDEYYYGLAKFSTQGYASFLHGSVVDMFFFRTHFDKTFWSNEPFIFEFPIFNVSDSAITIGVIAILIFQKKFFKHEKKEPTPTTNVQ